MNNLEKNRENSDHLSFGDKLKNLRDSILGKNDLGKKETVEDIKGEVSEKLENLKRNKINSELEKLRFNVDRAAEFTEIQKNTQDALEQVKSAGKENVHSHPRSSAVEKSYVLENRDERVAAGINQSSKNVEDDIKNWDKEQNPVARSLLNIANKIMGTERT